MPDQGLNLYPLQCKCGVLITGVPGKSLIQYLMTFLSHQDMSKKKKRKTNHCVKIMMLRIFLALKNHQTSFIIIVMFITILHTHTKSKKNKLYRPSLLIYKYRGSSRTISLQLLKFKSSFLGNKIRTITTKNLLKKEVKLILTPHKLMTRCNC